MGVQWRGACVFAERGLVGPGNDRVFHSQKQGGRQVGGWGSMCTRGWGISQGWEQWGLEYL